METNVSKGVKSDKSFTRYGMKLVIIPSNSKEKITIISGSILLSL